MFFFDYSPLNELAAPMQVTAVFAADAVSRLSGVPGVAIVTAGPGRENMEQYNIFHLHRLYQPRSYPCTPPPQLPTMCTGLTNTVTAIKNAQMAEVPLVLLGGAASTLLKAR